MKILKIIYYFREKWEINPKKEAKLLHKFVCHIFDLFCYCLQNVQNIFWIFFTNFHQNSNSCQNEWKRKWIWRKRNFRRSKSRIQERSSYRLIFVKVTHSSMLHSQSTLFLRILTTLTYLVDLLSEQGCKFWQFW